MGHNTSFPVSRCNRSLRITLHVRVKKGRLRHLELHIVSVVQFQAALIKVEGRHQPPIPPSAYRRLLWQLW